jgi:hypothetical protein
LPDNWTFVPNFSGIEALQEDKKAGLGQGDIESFSDEKRVTLARYFYDAYSRFFNIKSAKPTSLKSIATIANELDANMQKVSIKKGGQEGEEFNRINALRAAFTSLYQPEETASYFKRLGFPLKNKEYNTPVPQPKDPDFPERTPVQYYEKILPNINNQMQLLLQREMDYSRAISNKDGPNRYDLYNRQKLKERLQEKTDNFSLTEIKDGEILQSSEKTNRVHPTQKPVVLATWTFDKFNCGNIVLDLFGGSGSTLVACEQTKRTCFMMEYDPRYCDVIRKRYAKFIGKEDEWETITPQI